MADNLRVLLVVFSILLFLILLNLLSKNKVPVRYSLLWFLSAILIFVVGAFPDFVGMFTKFIGFETTSNLVIGIILVMLLSITLILTIIVSGHKQKIKLLVQELSILKAQIEENIDKKDSD